jgi:hypothetical protein
MISLVFTKVGHRRSRQTRLRHIPSGGLDYTSFEKADARRPDNSHPPDAIPPIEAGPRHVEAGGFEWTLSKPAHSSAGVGATSTAAENAARPPRLALPRPLAFASSLCSSHISLLKLQLNPLFLKSYFFNSENIS